MHATVPEIALAPEAGLRITQLIENQVHQRRFQVGMIPVRLRLFSENHRHQIRERLIELPFMIYTCVGNIRHRHRPEIMCQLRRWIDPVEKLELEFGFLFQIWERSHHFEKPLGVAVAPASVLGVLLLGSCFTFRVVKTRLQILQAPVDPVEISSGRNQPDDLGQNLMRQLGVLSGLFAGHYLLAKPASFDNPFRLFFAVVRIERDEIILHSPVYLSIRS